MAFVICRKLGEEDEMGVLRDVWFKKLTFWLVTLVKKLKIGEKTALHGAMVE